MIAALVLIFKNLIPSVFQQPYDSNVICQSLEAEGFYKASDSLVAFTIVLVLSHSYSFSPRSQFPHLAELAWGLHKPNTALS
jgi:hypothetical protein